MRQNMIVFTWLVSLILLLGAGLLFPACSKTPGTHAGHGDTTAIAPSVDSYTCPMHPQVQSDKPGVCPICGMDLVKASNSEAAETTPGSDAGLALSGRDQLLANVATFTVGYDTVERTVRAYGNIALAEPNNTLISARFNGRIEKLHVDAVGATVRAGDPLFDLYSPDIVQAANEYLQSMRAGPGAQVGSALIRSKLQLLGLTEKQIQEIGASETAPLVMTYHSPASGTVIDKKIVKGSYVSEGETLYDISDLSVVWNIAEVYESDAGHITVGETAMLSTSAYPGRSFRATVSLVYPVVNPQSRTVKVRLVVRNASGALRPNMYTETVFRKQIGRSITVPVSAVLVTGKRNLVYVKLGHENHFQAREVGLGVRFDGRYEITHGLQEGDEVVTEGGYLIDSESQLKTGSGAAHQHGDGSTGGSSAKEPEGHNH